MIPCRYVFLIVLQWIMGRLHSKSKCKRYNSGPRCDACFYSSYHYLVCGQKMWLSLCLLAGNGLGDEILSQKISCMDHKSCRIKQQLSACIIKTLTVKKTCPSCGCEDKAAASNISHHSLGSWLNVHLHGLSGVNFPVDRISKQKEKLFICFELSACLGCIVSLTSLLKPGSKLRIVT